MSNPNQLFLLADHVKLSLLERQRAQSLNLDNGGGGGSQDGHIARSLEQFREGLTALSEEKSRLEQQGDTRFVATRPYLPAALDRAAVSSCCPRPHVNEPPLVRHLPSPTHLVRYRNSSTTLQPSSTASLHPRPRIPSRPPTMPLSPRTLPTQPQPVPHHLPPAKPPRPFDSATRPPPLPQSRHLAVTTPTLSSVPAATATTLPTQPATATQPPLSTTSSCTSTMRRSSTIRMTSSTVLASRLAASAS